MGSSVAILSLILLGSILQRSECVVLEAWKPSTTSQPSTTYNLSSDLDGQIVSYVIRSVDQAADSTIQEEVKASPEQGSSTPESSTMDAATTKSNEKDLNKTEDSPQGLIIDLGAIRNIRAKRDTDDEEPSSSEDSDEVMQDDTCDTCDQREAVVEDSPVQGDSSSMEVEDDTANAESNEDSADQMGEEESLESSEQREGRMDQSWYRQPDTKKTDWSGSESQPKREFITIPVFPGK